MKKCSCGFIVATDNGWLLCHPTNSANNWDLPKGVAEEGEHHFQAAMRELKEETGLELNCFAPQPIDLGQHPYNKDKDLHLFYLQLEQVNTKVMHCSSMVLNEKGPDFPEMDAFAVFEHVKLKDKLSPRMYAWVKKHLPTNISEGI